MKKLFLAVALLAPHLLAAQDCHNTAYAVGTLTERYDQVRCSETTGCTTVERYVVAHIGSDSVTFQCSKNHQLNGQTIFAWCATWQLGACLKLQGRLVTPFAASQVPPRSVSVLATYGADLLSTSYCAP